MKVLQIIQRYPPAIGGSETWCRNLVVYLSSQGINTEVATINLFNMDDFFKDFPDERQTFKLGDCDFDAGAWVRRFKLWSFAYKGFSFSLAGFLLNNLHLYSTELGAIFQHSPHSFQMYRNLKGMIKDANIVHLHTLPYFHNLVGFLIAKLQSKKIVITPHFHPGHKHYERKIFYKLMNHCDAVLAMTEYEKDYLVKKGVSASRIWVIGNSIDTKNIVDKEKCDQYAHQISVKYGIASNAKKIVFVGRKDIYKGVFTLIEVAEKLSVELKEQMVIFFVGPRCAEFTKKYGNISGTDKFKIIDFGSVEEEEKEKIIAFSDVLVLYSEFEAFGIVFLEAWKYKKPVIGSDRGAVSEVIKDAGLCARYDDKEDLKAKIKKILYDGQLAQRYGEAGKKKLDQNFSLDQVGGKVLRIYRDLTSKQRKVLIVSCLFPPYAIGGAEVVAYQQARVLKKMGFDIQIFAGRWDPAAPRFSVTSLKSEFEITFINLYDIDFDYRSVNFYKQEIMDEFSRRLFAYAPDIVHFHNISSLCLRMIDECHAKAIPTVMTLHDYWLICPKSILVADTKLLCDKKTKECTQCDDFFFVGDQESDIIKNRNRIFMEHLNYLDTVISPSTYLINRFKENGLNPQKGIVINNGIDLSRFKVNRKTISKKLRFAFIGQILEHKGILVLLKSISLLNQKERNQISLSIIGSLEGFFVRFIKDYIEELKIEEVVKFMGKIPNERIVKAYSKIDVLVVPSLWPENSPVTIMEALASGTPILASRIGGIPELIEHAKEGFLYTHDNPQELAEMIRSFILKPDLCKKMRQACLERAKLYPLEKQVNMIANCYKALLDRDRKEGIKKE